jgi:hypothetical protein
VGFFSKFRIALFYGTEGVVNYSMQWFFKFLNIKFLIIKWITKPEVKKIVSVCQTIPKYSKKDGSESEALVTASRG